MEEGEVGFEAEPGGVEDGQDDEGGLHFSHLLGEAGGEKNCIFLCKIREPVKNVLAEFVR